MAAQKLLERFFEVVLGEKRLDDRPTKQLRLTYDASQTDDGRKRTVPPFKHDADEIIRRPAIKIRRCCKKTAGSFVFAGQSEMIFTEAGLQKINALTFDFT